MLFYVGVVSRVTANDSDVSDGETLTGSQVVRVYGNNLTAPFVTLTFGDVEYTPLTQGEGYIEFILGDNGTATINVDGSRFMSFEVEGITIPSELPVVVSAGQRDNVATDYQPTHVYEYSQYSRRNCLNFPRLYNSTYPYFYFIFNFSAESRDDFAVVNGTIEASNVPAPTSRFVISVTDISKPAYLTYKDFIIAVFNYTTE